MDGDERADIVEIDADRWITLDFSREWPKYVVTWSIRKRSGDGDFPQGAGRLERMPPRDGMTVEELQEEMRAAAVEAAHATLENTPEPSQRPSLLKRLLGRP